jgi:uncharacterized membrane protein YebE (DUF533 family)
MHGMLFAMQFLSSINERGENMKSEGNGNGHKVGSVALSFLVGGIVGAGVALLLAPESGRKMRKRIVHFAEDAKEKAEGSLEGVKDKVTTSFERGKVLLKRA